MWNNEKSWRIWVSSIEFITIEVVSTMEVKSRIILLHFAIIFDSFKYLLNDCLILYYGAIVFEVSYKSMPGDTFDGTCTCTRAYKIQNTSEQSPLPTSLSNVQSRMRNRNFVVTTATLVHSFIYSLIHSFIHSFKFFIQGKVSEISFTNYPVKI